jgi:hypothetical protein
MHTTLKESAFMHVLPIDCCFFIQEKFPYGKVLKPYFIEQSTCYTHIEIQARRNIAKLFMSPWVVIGVHIALEKNGVERRV